MRAPPDEQAGSQHESRRDHRRYQIRQRAVALCHSRQQAEQVNARLAEWLVPRGLAFNEDKTRVVPFDEGLDFEVGDDPPAQAVFVPDQWAVVTGDMPWFVTFSDA